MKVLLVKPPYTNYRSAIGSSPYEPLGLMYLASYIRHYSDSEVKVIDALLTDIEGRWEGDFYKVGWTDEMIKKAIADFQPDIVGISSMFTIHSKGCHDAARVVKEYNKDIPVFIGGAHASAFPDWSLKDNHVDFVIVGEGEQTLLEIIKLMKEKKPFINIPGLSYRKNNEIVNTGTRELIKDLDSIPFPARDLVDYKGYLYADYNYNHSMAPPRATVVSSRGCPYRCTFCSIHALWKHSYRMRSPNNVVDEIELLVKEYGVREIAFFDDNISVNRKRMLELCEEIIRRKLNIRWCTPNGIAIWTLDKEVLLKMRKSGCYKLTFGIETGSKNTQKFIRKEQINLEKTKELIAYCNKIGIWTHSTFIIGFPYETEQDFMDTINYAISCGVDMGSFFIATPYPGTELYDIYEKEGLLPDIGEEKSLQWLGNVGQSMTHIKNFTAEQVQGYLSIAQRKLYVNRALSFLNPFRVIPRLRGFDEIRYFYKQTRSYGLKLIRNLLMK